MARRYDYATPIFGGDFCCAPPPVEKAFERPSTRKLPKQESISQAGLTRADSSGRGTFSRTDSLSRKPLTRGDSSASRTFTSTSETSYSSSGAGGRPTTFSSTTYSSPYGNNYRSISYK